MNTNSLIHDDEILYNELPVKCTESNFNKDDCTFYRDLPTLMNDSEKKILANYHFDEKPTLEQAANDFKCGCEQAFNYLYDHYKKKINYVASKYKDEDLVQELSMVLHNCTQKYEAGGSSCFNTLFWNAAQHHIGMLKVRKNSKKRKNEYGEVSLNMTLSKDTEDTIENFVEDKNTEADFDEALFYNILNKNILPALDELDRTIVTMIIDEYSIKDIAEKLNMNTAGVYLRLRHIRDMSDVGDILKSLYFGR